jgi:hypothetical protein
MKKIRLDPDALNVQSFATVTGLAIRTGTVQGHQADRMSIVTFCTEGGSCIDGPCKPDSRISQCVC